MTVPPQELVTHLAQSELVPSKAIWSAAVGGRTNRLWFARWQDIELTVKLYSETENPLFPNDPRSEARVLRDLAGLQIAPDFHARTRSSLGEVLLYRTWPGRCWTTNTADVGILLRHLHTQPKPKGLRFIPQGPEALMAQAAAMIKSLSKTALPPCPPPRVVKPVTPEFLHADVVPGNLITGPDGLRLIDWQCPATGDPCEDLSIFMSPAMQYLYRGAPLSQQEKHRFLSAYNRPALHARLEALAPYFHYRMAAYCLWKMAQGETDYATGFELECAALATALA